MVVTDATMVKPHVAVLPSVGMGHFIPLFELAKRLVVHHGLRVSLLLITTHAPSGSLDLDQLLCSSDLPTDLHIVKLPPVEEHKLATDHMLTLTRLCVITDHSLRSLNSVLIALGKPIALVVDLFSTQAFDVCNKLGIPVYLFATTSAAFSAFSLFLPTLDRDVDFEFVDIPEPIKVPGCSPVRTEDLLDQVRDRKIEEYRWFFLHISRMPLACGIFLNSWEDLEPVPIQAIKQNHFFKQIPTPPVYPVGPLIKRDETKLSTLDVECLKWLDKQPPDSVLFVSLGSGGTLSMEQQTELAWGLELSKQRFVWVVRKPTDATCAGAFFDVGNDEGAINYKAYLPQGFLDRTQSVGFVLPCWGPQVAILSHPSTGGFLSHCGWNSSLESIAHGVPMIAWPLYAGQRMNATILVEDIGVGLKPKAEAGRTIFGREEIERVVRMVMEGEEGKVLRNKVKELKKSAAQALGFTGSSYDSLDFISQQWKKSLNP